MLWVLGFLLKLRGAPRWERSFEVLWQEPSSRGLERANEINEVTFKVIAGSSVFDYYWLNLKTMARTCENILRILNIQCGDVNFIVEHKNLRVVPIKRSLPDILWALKAGKL